MESDLLLGKGLPINADTERLVLGAILLNDKLYAEVRGMFIGPEDFGLEKHRRIMIAMDNLFERNERIERMSLWNEIDRLGFSETVEGISYLISLDDGMPVLNNIDSWVKTVRDCADRRRLIYASQGIISRSAEGYDRAPEIAAEAQASLLEIAAPPKERTLQHAGSLIEQQGLDELLRFGRDRGIPCGFAGLDDLTGGFQPGEMFVLAARPSMGKTAMAINMASRVAATEPRNPDRRGTKHGVAVFSLEMTKQALLQRLLCSIAEVDIQRLRKGLLTGKERSLLAEAANALYGLALYIDDTRGQTPLDMYVKLRRLSQVIKVDLVVIDFLQLIGLRGKVENRNQEIGRICRQLLEFAAEMGFALLVLSQLSRELERRQDKRPILSDLRDSGEVEQSADAVGFIYRNFVYSKKKEEIDQAELILAKQRNGPTGLVDLVWKRECTRFEDRTGTVERSA